MTYLLTPSWHSAMHTNKTLLKIAYDINGFSTPTGYVEMRTRRPQDMQRKIKVNVKFQDILRT